VDDIRGWDFVSLSASSGWPDEDVQNADNDPMDYGSHGTNCAGMAAGITNNGVGISGVAPGCKIMAVRCGWMPNGSNQGVVRMDFASSGFVYAINNGADIINCSWGSTSFLTNAVNWAATAGVLVVTAAGNDDTSNDPGQGVPSFLSTAPGVVCVAATNSSDGKATFSNFGNWVEISAPGVGIFTTAYFSGSQTHGYATVQGTSFSSPITCGAAALIWSAMPGLTVSQLRGTLYNSADNIDAVNPGHIGLMGAGRVNLLKALGDNVHQFPLEFPTVYDALNSAASGDTIAIVGSAVLSAPVIVPGKSLKVLGGYSADYSSRDPLANPTQITGVVNNHGLRFFGDVDNTTEVDGFLIVGGGGLTYSGIPFFAEYGGGVMLNSASPTLRNLEIVGNTVGDSSQLGCGGGLMMTNSAPVLENVHIHDNTAVYGAGLFAFDSTPTMIDCVIENNFSIADNLGFAPIGGGIHALDSSLNLVNCSVNGHLEQINGGGIYLAGHNTSSSLDMTGGEITSTFMHGGGIFATAATVSLDSLTCTNNVSMIGGGMELNGNTSAVLTNSLLADNSAQFVGGGLSYDTNAAGTISGNTIAGNSGITGAGGLFLNGSAPAVTNNIVAFNTGGTAMANGMALASAPSTLSCNDAYGNDNSDYSGQPDPTGTNGNISADPLFCGIPVGAKDAFDGTSAWGISTGSPCAADNSGGCGVIGAFTAGCGAAAVPDDNAGVPMAFLVEQNFPNPFNPKTTIRFALPSSGRTQVNIFDVAGRHVRTLLDEDLAASSHQVTWSGDDDRGRGVSAGVYFYMVTSGNDRQVGRMALVK